LVETGDVIALDVPKRRLELKVPAGELKKRRARLKPRRHPGDDRGYLNLYLSCVTQAGDGCDFEFLKRRKATAKTP
jgi:dihydroxy-acid dehydratase